MQAVSRHSFTKNSRRVGVVCEGLLRSAELLQKPASRRRQRSADRLERRATSDSDSFVEARERDVTPFFEHRDDGRFVE